MNLAQYNAAQTYKETAIKTADGGEIIVLLYEGIDKHLSEAIVLLEKEQKHHYFDKINYHITFAQKIITELMTALDSSQDKAIYDNLMDLYLYFNNELSKANMKKDCDVINHVHTMIKELLETWKKALHNSASSPQMKKTGINISR